MRVGPARWIRSPRRDVAVALAWLPFALVAHAVAHDVDAVALVLSTTFLISFLHQPLTLPLVYGDTDQYRSRRTLFTWSPVVFVLAVTLGLHISLVLVAIVAGLWNAEHTLMQRFGLTRIYGRKAGEDDGRLEKAMLVSWLVLAILWIGADPATPGRVTRLPLGRVNTEGVQRLTDLRPWTSAMVWPTLALAIGLACAWLVRESRRAEAGGANPAKWVYVGATAALFVWMLVDPVAGFIGYVGAHAVEYFVIVNHSLTSRYDDGSGGPLGAAMRTRNGRPAFFAAYVAAFLVLVAVLKTLDLEDAYAFVVLVLGGLHVFYDGFIWKLRKPSVARGLVTAAAS